MNAHAIAHARLNSEALENLPLGVVRLSTDQRITYVNRSAQEIGGPDFAVGVAISDLAMAPESRARVQAEVKARFETHRGSSYRLRLVNRELETLRIVEVSAVPEYGDDGGLIGSLALLRDITLETAAIDMHKAVAKADTWERLLFSVSALLQKHISFDSMMLTVLSTDGRHLRLLIDTDPEYVRPEPQKWWRMSDEIKAELSSASFGSLSLRELFRMPEYERLPESDSQTREFLKRGFTHFLRYPIYQRGSLIAIMSLLKREDRPFTEFEQELFRQLPIEETVNVAKTLETLAQATFALNLIRDISAEAANPKGIYARLVGALQQHFRWEHVSLLSVDYDSRVFRLVCQSNASNSALPSDFTQPFNEGLLGIVLETRQAVTLSDVRSGPLADKYIAGYPGARSEMCLPLPGPKLRWILNVESTELDAFADEERTAVELLLGVVGYSLDRLATIELKSALFQSVADAVIITSRDGIIESTNPAAETLLGATPGGLTGRNLCDFISTTSAAGANDKGGSGCLLASEPQPPTPVDVSTITGKRVSVLASGGSLPSGLGGRVFVLTDLTYPIRLHQLETLKQIFGTVAGETRVPLALAAAFLEDVAAQPQDASELANKALAQIRKADLPLERLLRLSARTADDPLPTSILDIPSTISRLLEELPRHQANAVTITTASREALARARATEFAFCFQSIVAFLLRTKAEVDRLQVRIAIEGDKTAVGIALQHRTSNTDPESPKTPDDDALFEFSLPQYLISNLIERMGGTYRGPQPDDPRFVLTLPSA